MGETSSLTRAQVWSIWAVILICVFLPFTAGNSFKLFGYVIGFNENGVFYLLALIPGAAAIIHHVVSRSSGQGPNFEEGARYHFIRRQYISHADEAKNTGTGSAETPDVRLRRATLSAVASALLLSSVFLLVASAFDRWGFANAPVAIKGLVAAGLGAYVSVVYYMTARMYANALSSRFVSASALRAAFSTGFGIAATSVGVIAVLPGGQTPWVTLFLVGLFQNAAYSAIRTRANTWFGNAKPENEELPLDSIQGIDDTTIDLMREYGVSTIQQVADTDAADFCARTLIPITTLADWIDQAILIRELQRKITAARLVGIRSGSDLARTFLRGRGGDKSAVALLNTLGQKTELGDDGINQLGQKLADSAAVKTVFEYRNGIAIGTVAAPPADFDQRFDQRLGAIIIADGATGEPSSYRLQIKAAVPPPNGGSQLSA